MENMEKLQEFSFFGINYGISIGRLLINHSRYLQPKLIHQYSLTNEYSL